MLSVSREAICLSLNLPLWCAFAAVFSIILHCWKNSEMPFWPLTCSSYNNTALLQNTCFGVRLPCVLYMCLLDGAGSLQGDCPSLHPRSPLVSSALGHLVCSLPLCHPQGLPQIGLYAKYVYIFILQNQEVKRSGLPRSEHQLKSDRPRLESWFAPYLNDLGYIS